jgi:predicted O-methyltransferase YrrM
MNPVLEEILHTQTVKSESGKQIALTGSGIPPEEGRFLQKMVDLAKPSVSVEVGLAFGISALYICEALAQQPAAHHIVIDPHQFRPSYAHQDHPNYEGAGLYSLQRAGYGNLIEYRELTSEIALPQLVSEGIKIEFAFIDGWHTFDAALVDFFYVDRLLRPGGIVVIDDTHFQSLWPLCRYIITNRAYRVEACLPIPLAEAPRDALHPWRNKYGWAASRALRSIIRRDGLIPHSRAVAFRKLADDSRTWNFHRPF